MSSFIGTKKDNEPRSTAVLFADIDTMKEEVRQKMCKEPYDVKTYYHKEGFWSAIATNKRFEHFTLAVISFNALWMAIDTDNNKADGLLDAEPIFQVAENGFCVFFSFEWFARYMSFQRKRDGLRDGWFVFDSVLVLMMVGETWVLTAYILVAGAGGDSPLGNAGILRLFRLLRLSRMMRMMRSMPELLILIKGMVSAIRSVGFAILLLVIIMYIFAIAFVQLLAEKRGTYVNDSGEEMMEAGALYFPAIPYSMYTLLVTGTFLDNLTQVSSDIGHDSAACVALFFLFVLLAALTVMNMLIGILCEVIAKVSDTEKEDILLTFVRERMREVLHEIDEDGSGDVSKREFHNIIKHPAALAALMDVDVDPVALLDFTDQIFEGEEDEEGHSESTTLNFDEFMKKVLQFRGVNNVTMRDLVSHRKVLCKFVQKELRKQTQHMKMLLDPEARLSTCSCTLDGSMENKSQSKALALQSTPGLLTVSDCVRELDGSLQGAVPGAVSPMLRSIALPAAAAAVDQTIGPEDSRQSELLDLLLHRPSRRDDGSGTPELPPAHELASRIARLPKSWRGAVLRVLEEAEASSSAAQDSCLSTTIFCSHSNTGQLQ